MTLEPTDKRRHRRRLSEEERRLWNGVIRSIAPLKRKPAGAHLQDAIPAPGERKPPPPPKRRRPEPTPARQPTPKPAIKPAAKPALPVIGLDRRQKQRLVRGTETIDARIDLHGKTQGEAHEALLGFLRRAQAQGARYVLVITGKGRAAGPSSGEHGILKRQVPMWLRLPEFRPHVLAVEDAHAAHGGEGALYVRVRKARAPRE
jgi:DNA-nicking Smr family endonuclease